MPLAIHQQFSLNMLSASRISASCKTHWIAVGLNPTYCYVNRVLYHFINNSCGFLLQKGSVAQTEDWLLERFGNDRDEKWNGISLKNAWLTWILNSSIWLFNLLLRRSLINLLYIFCVYSFKVSIAFKKRLGLFKSVNWKRIVSKCDKRRSIANVSEDQKV